MNADGDIAIVGCGSIGRRHAANAARVFGAARVAVADLDAELAARSAAEAGVRAHSSIDALFASRPLAVIVATPHAEHVPIARRALAAGADVLVEKPIALSQEEADALVDEAASRGRRLYVACNMRFHPGIAALRDGMKLIGRPIFARAMYGSYLPEMRPGVDFRVVYSAQRARGGGVVLDSIHEFDYLISLFGPVTRVSADIATAGDLGIDVEDHAISMLRHTSGVRANVHLDFLRRAKLRGCEIVGSDATIDWTSFGKRPERFEVTRSDADGRVTLSSGEVDPNAPYIAMLAAFRDVLMGGSSSILATGAEGAEALAVALAVLRAAGGSPVIPRGLK